MRCAGLFDLPGMRTSVSLLSLSIRDLFMRCAGLLVYLPRNAYFGPTVPSIRDLLAQYMCKQGCASQHPPCLCQGLGTSSTRTHTCIPHIYMNINCCGARAARGQQLALHPWPMKRAMRAQPSEHASGAPAPVQAFAWLFCFELAVCRQEQQCLHA